MQHWQERNKSSDRTQLSCNLLMLEPEIAKGVFDLKCLSMNLLLLSLWGIASFEVQTQFLTLEYQGING